MTTSEEVLSGTQPRPNARSEAYNLTKKQTKFAEVYIETNDPIHALVEAGYAPVNTNDGSLDRTRTASRAQQYLAYRHAQSLHRDAQRGRCREGILECTEGPRQNVPDLYESHRGRGLYQC